MSDVKKRIGYLSRNKLALLSEKLKERSVKGPQRKIERRPNPFAPCQLSFAQQRLWFIDQLVPNNSFYNNPGAVMLEGGVDIWALERSVNEIVRRHEVLRTRFEVEKGEPVQLIDAWEPAGLEIEDLTNLGREERAEKATRIAREEAETGFDLKRGPLLRVKVLKLEKRRHLLLFTMHHIVSDEWSMEILTKEVRALYQAYNVGEPSPLEELPVQYADFAIWQREWLKGEALERELGYWREQLARMEELELPTDFSRPAVLSYRGAGIPFVIEREVAVKLRALAQQEGATLFMTLLAAFQTLLMRYSGQEDIAVGSPVANRDRPELEGLIGFFVNTLVMRTDLSGNPSFIDLLRRVREVTLGAYTHQDLPFERLVEEIQPERSLGRHPLFQVMMVAQNAPTGALELPGLSLNSLPTERSVIKFDLTLSVIESDAEWTGTLEYSSDLFEPATIRRMLGHWTRLLREISASPEQRVTGLQMLTDAEQRQLLLEYNDTVKPFSEDACFHDLFRQQVMRTPERVAVTDGDERLTYAELESRTNQLARYLRKLGVEPESTVGLMVDRSLEMLTGMIGILKAGGAYVPLDPHHPRERTAFILEDAQVKVLLTRQPLAETLSRNRPQTVCLDSDWKFIAKSSAEKQENTTTAGNLAYVLYTSGSTGLPKGTMIEHRSLVNYLCWVNQCLFNEAGHNIPATTSLTFDASLKQLLAPLLRGDEVWLLSNTVMTDPAGLLRKLNTRENVVFNCVPSLWTAILDAIQFRHGAVPAVNLTSLFIGGEHLSAELVKRSFAQLPDLKIWNLYGPTEATANASVARIFSEKEISIGRPIANTRLYILNSGMEPIPVGVRGEVHIAGTGLARGYVGRPDLTAERFIPDLFSQESGGRLYRTGDVCRYLSDGKVEFIGRVDDQVKIRGYRIELGEIKAALDEHRMVKQSVVVASEDGSGGNRLIGYVVGQGVTESELKKYLREKLPEYMVPSAIVALEKMPLTPSGKLDRQALPTPDGAETAREYEAPVGTTETRLAQIWAGLLKLERVGRNDNFFELGGHSLLAIRLIEEMRREGLYADVRALFASPTLAVLAAAVGGDSGVVEVPPNRIPPGCEAITPEMLTLAQLSAGEIERVVAMVPGGAANVQDVYPLAPLQQGILFHHLMTTEGDVYLSPTLLSFDSRDRLERFLRAMQLVIDRHDILRTAILWEGLRESAQVVYRQAPLRVEEVNFDPAMGETAEQLLARFNPRSYRIDIRQAPLLRVYIAPAELGEDARERRWIMLYLFHHLVGDHTTSEVLRQEIQAHLEGQADQLPTPLPFRNFVAQARFGVSRQEHEAFFKEMLASVDETTAPFGLIDVQGDGASVKEAQYEINAQLASRLRQSARALGVGVASLCHLAWARVLARISGREDVVFGTVLFGRMQGGEGADRVIGLFMNTLPIRIRVGDEGVKHSVRQTHQLLSRLMRHEHAPLALAQRCSGVAAPLPLFSSLLNYRHSSREVEQPSGAASAWAGIQELGAEERTNYPITLSVDDLGDGFALTAQTVAPIDPGRICEFMRIVLEGMVELLQTAPETSVRAIDMLPEAERRQVLTDWNATEQDYPEEKRIHQLFEARVEQSPDAIALLYEQESLTYSKLNKAANRLAHYLREFGVGPEARVAICLERSVEMVVALLATLKAGAAYAPLDPAYPPERLAYLLDDCSPTILLTHDAAKAALTRRPPALPILNLNSDVAQWADQSESNPDQPMAGLQARHLAYIIYTSGSTGLPKGAMNEHRAVVNRLYWMQQAYGLGSQDAVLQKTPFSFDVSVWEFFWPLLFGARLVMARPEGHRDSGYLAQIIQEQGITTIHFVPAMLQVFLEDRRASICRNLARVICSGEVLSTSLAEHFYELLPETEIHNLYGPTEAAVDVTAWNCKQGTGGVSVPIGRPISNTRIYILDAHGQPAPVGVAGELYIGGVQVGRGYLNRPELSAEYFPPDPFSCEPGTRMYKTGDLSRWLPEGNIEYLGRADFQVKIHGVRIELGEIESRLSQHPGVREAVALAREDGQGDKRLVAYCTPAKAEGSAATIDGEALRAYLSVVLPAYMLPASYVWLDQMPLSPNGKVDRRALAGLELKNSERRRGYVAPRTPVEEILAGIFEEVLKLDRVGVDDNFFEIGGHSLLATQVISRVRNRFNVVIEVRNIFDKPTVGALARRIVEAMNSEWKDEAPPLVRIKRERQTGVRLPLSFAQQRLWFIEQLEPGNTVYNIPCAVRLEGRLDINALESVVNEIVRRHDALRTRIEVDDGESVQEPMQVIDEWEPRSLEVEDLTTLSREEKEEEVRMRARAEAEAGFDLSRGPLLRVKVLRLEDHEHVALFTMHHIVSDGWSMGVLIREVGELYRAYCAGEEAPLKELPIQYADYAVWQRGWLQGARLQKQITYWSKQLYQAPELQLPGASSSQNSDAAKGASHMHVIPAGISRAVKNFAVQKESTLFMALLAAFALALHRSTGQKDLVIGTDIANRNRVEVESLIGFFVNELVLRIKIEGDPTFDDFLAQVRETALDAYLHQDIPFDKLVEILKPERRHNQTPFIRAKLVVQNVPTSPTTLPGLTIDATNDISGANNGIKCDFLLTFFERESEIIAHVSYNGTIISKSTTVAILHNIESLLTLATEDPALRLSALISGIGNIQRRQRREKIADSLSKTL